MLPSPFCTPCHFHWPRELFLQEGEHFARCTHMLQEWGRPGGLWERTGAEPCMRTLPPRPPDSGK